MGRRPVGIPCQAEVRTPPQRRSREGVKEAFAIRRLIGGLFAAAVMVVAVVPGVSHAQGADKVMKATGVVSAVTPGSISVKVKAEDVKFTVDKDTSVMGKAPPTRAWRCRPTASPPC